MEIVDHLLKQNEIISKKVDDIRADVLEIKSDVKWILESANDSKKNIEIHAAKINKMENLMQSTKLILTKIGALGVFLAGSYGTWTIVIK